MDGRTYHFNFWKDHFWLWALLLPFGLSCWGVPFLLGWGLLRSGMENGAVLFIVLVLGVAAYLVGYIFVYSFMEGMITKVTFTQEGIVHRTPNIIFPILWSSKKVFYEDLISINKYVHYGTRLAIYLYYRSGNKTRHFYLPRFNNQPGYFDEINKLEMKFTGAVNPP